MLKKIIKNRRILIPLIVVFILTLIPVAIFPKITTSKIEYAISLEGHWIHVDLGNLTITAYNGSDPLYTALITAGKPGFDTSPGVFTVLRRVKSEIMDSATIGIPRNAPEGYYLANVLYTQYYEWDGTAIHGNYWSPDWVFGNLNVSHGCVSMRNSDAAYFWGFASIGTPIIIDSPGENIAASLMRNLPPPNHSENIIMPQEKSAANQTQVISEKQANSTNISTMENGHSPNSIQTISTPIEVLVPEVVGLLEAEGRSQLQKAGFIVSKTNYQKFEDVAENSRWIFESTLPGHILSITPAQGTFAERGSLIQIAVREP